MDSFTVTIKTDSPEIHRKALMLNLRQHFKEIGLKHYMALFLQRFPEYQGCTSTVKNVFIGRQDDAEIVRCFQVLAREHSNKDYERAANG